MALYSNSAFGPPFKRMMRMTQSTPPIYLFGAFDTDTQPFLFTIDHVSITGNVATYAVTIKSGGGGVGGGVGSAIPGPIPQVGAKMGVQGTQSNAGLFNVDPAIVTAVTLDANGVGTISCALTHANIASTADVGALVVQPFESPDLVVQGSASRPVALAFTPDDSDNARCLAAEAKWSGTLPTAATVVLEWSNIDDDGRFYVLKNTQGNSTTASVASSDALATITGSAVTQNGAQYNYILGKFLRAKVLSMTGGDGTTGLCVTLFP